MRQARFDTRLIQVLSAMAALSIMVGLAAIGVNRYLIHSHDALMDASLPAIERASQVGAATEVVGSLAAALVQADNDQDLNRIAEALSAAVTTIESGSRADADFGPDADGMSPAGQIVARITLDGHERLRLTERIQQEAARLARWGKELEGAVGAETDLARVRITAGIADLYTGAPDSRGATDQRLALDALADR